MRLWFRRMRTLFSLEIGLLGSTVSSAARIRIVAVAGPCQYENPSWWARLYPKLLFGAVDRVFAWTGRVFYISATNTAFRRSAFPGYDSTTDPGR